MVGKIDGWVSDIEGELLYDLARNCKGDGVIVEIGSWKGKSTIWLGKGSKAGNKLKVYAIDPHTGSHEHKKESDKVWTFEEFKKNISKAQVEDVVVPIPKASEETAKNFNQTVELIFIDGAHDYDSAKLDFELWFPKVKDGGVMAFHDTIGWRGPTKVVRESVYNSKNFRNIGLVGSITYAEKVGQKSTKDTFRDRYVLILNYMCEFASKLHPPKSIRAIGKKLVKMIQ